MLLTSLPMLIFGTIVLSHIRQDRKIKAQAGKLYRDIRAYLDKESNK